VLIWAVGVFAGLQLTASLLLDYCWPLLRFPSARKTLARLEHETERPEILSLGSSRFNGVVAPEISRLLTCECRTGRPVPAFTAAIPFGDTIAGEFLLHRILNAGARPKLLVFEVSPEQLNPSNDWVGIHARRQLCWHDTPRYFVEVCRSMQLARWLGERVNPIFYHREELWSELDEALQKPAVNPPGGVANRAQAGPSESGPPAWNELLRPPDLPVTEELRNVSRSGFALLPRWLRQFRIPGSKADALERVLARCRDQRIDVLLIETPVSLGHRQSYSPEINAQFRAYIDRLTKNYGCRFVDYRDRVPDNLFVDNHHLGPEGGLYFSRLLTHEVLAPYWLKRVEGGR
jgi:hypothetical protein